MTGGQRDLIRYRMERAAETLQGARLMWENGHLHGEVIELDTEGIKADLQKAEEFITRIKSLLESVGDGSL